MLPQYQFKRNAEAREMTYYDFSICLNRSREELQKVFETEFRNHPKFIKLIGELYKKEIEFNFLEEAEVIKKSIIAE